MNKDMVEIRWHGRGGQGAKTACLLLADAAFSSRDEDVIVHMYEYCCNVDSFSFSPLLTTRQAADKGTSDPHAAVGVSSSSEP